MGLSPSTLFHFTSKSGLKGILKDNFKLKYCLEKIYHEEKPIELAIPMASLCDIKISEITEHIEKYGYYGIGLSKEWAVEKGLNPVIYLNSSSRFATSLIGTMRKLCRREDIDRIDKINTVNFLRYSKIYEGELTRKGKTIKKYRFADEREWRYVPEKKPDYLAWLSKKQYDTTEKKIRRNKEISHERLYFNPNQILYIIVKKEEEIKEIINHIRNVKGIYYTMDEIDRLTTRIISCERIINDF